MNYEGETGQKMRLTAHQSYALLERFWLLCEGRVRRVRPVLGPVHYTRAAGESGEWCSRECRGDATERPVIRKGGRPRKYKTNAERQRVYRSRLGGTKPTANPCASGGPGALAKRLNGAWVCN